MLGFFLFDGPFQFHHLGVVLDRSLVQRQVGDGARPKSVFGSEAFVLGGIPHGLLDPGRRRYVDRHAAELLIDRILGVGDLVEAEFPGDAARLLLQRCGQGILDVQHAVAHDGGRIENTPLDVDSGAERPGMSAARQVSCHSGAMQSEVDLIHGDGTAVQEHVLPFVRPYHQVVATLVDHHDGHVSAGSGQLPVPACLAQDRPSHMFRLRTGFVAVGLRLVYDCHGIPLPVGAGCRGWSDWDWSSFTPVRL